MNNLTEYYKCTHDKLNFYNVTCIRTYESCMEKKQQSKDFCIAASVLTFPDLAIRYNVANRLTVTVHNPPNENGMTHSEAVGFTL
jgi:hypothetical protein